MTVGDVNQGRGRWDEEALGPLTLEAVRRLYQPEARYRVRWNSHEAGVTYEGWARAMRRYVVSGSCVYEVAGRVWSLSGGEFADLPEGDYRFSASAESPVEFILVWELPESLWRNLEDGRPAA